MRPTQLTWGSGALYQLTSSWHNHLPGPRNSIWASGSGEARCFSWPMKRELKHITQRSKTRRRKEHAVVYGNVHKQQHTNISNMHTYKIYIYIYICVGVRQTACARNAQRVSIPSVPPLTAKEELQVIKTQINPIAGLFAMFFQVSSHD